MFMTLFCSNPSKQNPVTTLFCFEESLRSTFHNPVVQSINFAKYSTFFLRSKSSKKPRPSSLQHCLHSNKVTPPQQTWADTFLLQKRFPCFWYLTGSVQQRRDTHLLPRQQQHPPQPPIHGAFTLDVSNGAFTFSIVGRR